MQYHKNIETCGECPIWRRNAEIYREGLMERHNGNGYKAPVEEMFPYCGYANNHMPYDAEPECKTEYRA